MNPQTSILCRYRSQPGFTITCVLLVLCLLPIFSSGATQQLEEPPQLSIPPSDSNWDFYCDAVHKVETTDHLKCMRIGATTRLSVSGELRNRGEYFDHIDLGTNSTSSGSLLQRYILTGDLTVGDRIRIFSTLQSGLENGRTGGPRPTVDEDQLFVHEAFLQVRNRYERYSIDLRLGRQDLSFGAGRLMGSANFLTYNKTSMGLGLSFRDEIGT
jgi:hypothetical protein